MIRRPPRSTLFPTRRSSDLPADLKDYIEILERPERDKEQKPDEVIKALNLDQYMTDRKSTRLNSSHSQISYAVFCLKKKNKNHRDIPIHSHHAALMF